MAERPPAKFEFELLQFLAQHPHLSVREIYQQFGEPRGFIRGTIVKAMDRLMKKGLVQRQEVDGTYVYETVEGAESLEHKLVESFIRDRLKGRIKPIATFLAEAEGIDPEELRQLKELLDRIEP